MNKKQNRSDVGNFMYEAGAGYIKRRDERGGVYYPHFWCESGVSDDLEAYAKRIKKEACIEELEGLQIYIYGKGQIEAEEVIQDRLNILENE